MAKRAPRALILGGSGQVGRPLTQAFHAAGWETCALPRNVADLERPATLQAAFTQVQPDLVVNAAAMTDVDACTRDPERAWRVNATGPVALAGLCARHSIRLVHFSTDAVFDGEAGRAYREEDATSPMQTYGRTKRAAEEAVCDLLPSALVLRTAWVFGGGGGRDLAIRVLGWAMPGPDGQRPVVRAATDQISSPTHAGDLADMTVGLVQSGAEGLLHTVNRGSASRYDFASFLCALVGLPVTVEPVLGSSFPTLAARTRRTDLAVDRLTRLGLVPGTWQEALARDRDIYRNAARRLQWPEL